MQAFIARRNKLLTRALLLLLIASAADVLTMLLIPWLRDAIADPLADTLFHAWAAPAVLVTSLVVSLLIAAYLWLSAPSLSHLQAGLADLFALINTFHLVFPT